MEHITITCGDQRAVVRSNGATLQEYAVAGRDVIVPFAADEAPPITHGAVLAPWPNRLEGGRYRHDGHVYQLPLDEPERNNAIHGLVRDREWTLESVTDRDVRLRCDIDGEPGYPFAVRLTIRYVLAVAGLTVELTAANTGEETAPFGVGFHPWLSPGAYTVDECRLLVPADRWYECDERLLPRAVKEIPPALDFSTWRTLGETRLDDCFSTPPDVSDATGPAAVVRSRAGLASPDGCIAEVWMESPLVYWQVCTGDLPEAGRYYRSGVAVEPMTCPPNALATGESVIRLAPGRSVTVRFGLGLRRG